MSRPRARIVGFQMLSTMKAASMMKAWRWERMPRILQIEPTSLDPWRGRKQAWKLAKRTATTWWIPVTVEKSAVCRTLNSQVSFYLSQPIWSKHQRRCRFLTPFKSLAFINSKTSPLNSRIMLRGIPHGHGPWVSWCAYTCTDQLMPGHGTFATGTAPCPGVPMSCSIASKMLSMH